MYLHKTLLAIVATVGIAAAGCSGSDVQTRDGAVGNDSATGDSTTGDSTTGDSTTGDSTTGDGGTIILGDGGQPDSAPTFQCEKECLDVAPVLCVTDPADATACLECTKDLHCSSNGSAFGPICDTTQGFCSCTDDAQCATNPWGKKCSTDNTCSCEKAEDCPTGKVCGGEVDGLAGFVCIDACKTNDDCKAGSASICQVATGKCIGCKTDGDCKTDFAPFCDTAINSCVECTKGEQCADNMQGSACIAGSCACAADGDCKGTNPWGNKCVTKTAQDGTKYQSCGCDAKTDCTDNANGSSCFAKYKKCSCGSKAECTQPDLGACGAPYAGANYNHCQKACTKNPDCTAGGLGICEVATGVCVGCLATADCDAGAPICDPAQKTCVTCITDRDCTDAEAPFCDAGECVECKTNAECTDNKNGKLCASGTCACDTATDCGGKTWGNKCMEFYFGLIKRCACDGSADCSGNANGEVCDTASLSEDDRNNMCGCSDVGNCKDSTQTLCGTLYPGAPFSVCQSPCTKNDDCTEDGVGICDKTSKLCVSCLKTEDCATNDFDRTCDTSISGCVECLSNKDCGPSSLGPNCDQQLNYCTCADDTECTTNPNGKVCNADLDACGCDTDKDCPSASGKTCTGSYGDLKVCI